MNNKHTPGPWHTGRNTVVRNTIVYDENGNAICDCKTFHGKHRAEQSSANASLIATAPDLLAELQRTASYAIELMERAARLDKLLAEANGATLDHELGEVIRMRQQLSRNRIAITKATGEMP